MNRPGVPTETVLVTSQPQAAKNKDAGPVDPQPVPVVKSDIVRILINVPTNPLNIYPSPTITDAFTEPSNVIMSEARKFDVIIPFCHHLPADADAIPTVPIVITETVRMIVPVTD